MDILLFVFLGLAIIGLSFHLGVKVGRDTRPLAEGIAAAVAPVETGPRIIVNVPTSFEPIQPLPGDTTIEGKRAVLYWSVFKHVWDGSPNSSIEESGEWAIRAAESAVQTAFPSS